MGNLLPLNNLGATPARIIRVSGAIILMILIGFTLSSGARAAGETKCSIKGTKGADRLVGTKGRDVICGFGGNDLLLGKGGNDLLLGGKGKDVAIGDDGNDRLLGGPGNDRISGGKGNDKLYGQPQNDALFGGPGDDLLDGGGGTNLLDGGPGRSRCLSTATDTLAGTCDDEGPKLVALSFNPGSIDTSGGSRTVAISARLTDKFGGTEGMVILDLKNAATGHDQFALLERKSGDKYDGTYSGGVTLPRYSAQGRWLLSGYLTDQNGNSTHYGREELEKLGLPTGFDQTGVGDTQKPVIQEFELSSTSVDTSGSAQTIDVRMRISDDLSGIRSAGLTFQRPNNSSSQTGTSMRLVAGTELDGIYEAQVKLPRYSPLGAWKIGIGTTDEAGNSSDTNAALFAQKGWPDHITQTGPGDSTSPRITQFSVSPKAIDTTNGPQTVSLQFRATDDLSGLLGSEGPFDYGLSFSLNVNGVQARQQIDTHFKSGSGLDGVYEGSVTLPQGSTHGNWTLSGGLVDNAGNYDFVTEQTLNAQGLSSAFTNGS